MRYFSIPKDEESVFDRFKSDHATALDQLKKVMIHIPFSGSTRTSKRE